MYSFEDLRSVHLEITSKCNAACPMCLRTVAGGAVNPQLPLVELSIAQIQQIFPEKWVKKLRKIYLCGNYGDPIAAKDTLEVFKYFRSINSDIHLSMFTNGSARSVQWWSDIGAVVNEVHFSIDGLQDTNPIYRRNTNFDTIIKNAKAYIAAGGEAIWDYIVFRHNEHQVEQAKALAKELGFKKINIKKTGRFFSNTKSEVKTRQEVLNANGDVEYFLEMPTNEKYINAALSREDELVQKHGSLEKYMNTTRIDCKVANEKSVYISAEGLVFPCCWTANQLYPWYYKPQSSQVWEIIKSLKGNKDEISALKAPVEEIIKGEFFAKVQKSWEAPSITEGKLRPCAKTCGKEFDPFQEQFR